MSLNQKLKILLTKLLESYSMQVLTKPQKKVEVAVRLIKKAIKKEMPRKKKEKSISSMDRYSIYNIEGNYIGYLEMPSKDTQIYNKALADVRKKLGIEEEKR